MGKNNKAKSKGFKRVISKFKRLVTEDDNYYDPDAAILKPISRKPQEQNQVVLGVNEELKPQTEPISIMEDFEDFQANNSLVVDDLIKNVSQSLSMSVSTSMSLSAEHFDSDSVSTSESSLQDSLWENDSLETYYLDSSYHIIDQSDSEYQSQIRFMRVDGYPLLSVQARVFPSLNTGVSLNLNLSAYQSQIRFMRVNGYPLLSVQVRAFLSLSTGVFSNLNLSAYQNQIHFMRVSGYPLLSVQARVFPSRLLSFLANSFQLR